MLKLFHICCLHSFRLIAEQSKDKLLELGFQKFTLEDFHDQFMEVVHLIGKPDTTEDTLVEVRDMLTMILLELIICLFIESCRTIWMVIKPSVMSFRCGYRAVRQTSAKVFDEYLLISEITWKWSGGTFWEHLIFKSSFKKFKLFQNLFIF